MRPKLIGALAVALACLACAASVPVRADDGTWVEMGPPLRSQAAVVYDSARQRLVLFGGLGPDGPSNSVWTLPLRTGGGWAPLSVAGAAPAARYDHSAIYDPEGDRVFVAGGYDGDVTHRFGDLWTLEFNPAPHWVQWSPGNAPVARMEPRLAIDRARNRLEYFGGRTDFGNELGDAWTLDLTNAGASWQTQPIAGHWESGPVYILPHLAGPWTVADTLGGVISDAEQSSQPTRTCS